MENEISADEVSKGSSKDDSFKDLHASKTSIKSTKSVEKSTNSLNNTGSIKSEKDVHFAKSTVKIKSDKHDADSVKSNPDASLKVPNKIIANWRQACDRTRDRTRDLLKRWRTLPEYEANQMDPTKKTANNLEKTDSHTTDSGWSVHVWSNIS